jgi:hypothetical protein
MSNLMTHALRAVHWTSIFLPVANTCKQPVPEVTLGQVRVFASDRCQVTKFRLRHISAVSRANLREPQRVR